MGMRTGAGVSVVGEGIVVGGGSVVGNEILMTLRLEKLQD